MTENHCCKYKVRSLTCPGRHVFEGPIAVVLEQEVGSIFIVAENVRSCVAEDWTDNDTTATL